MAKATFLIVEHLPSKVSFVKLDCIVTVGQSAKGVVCRQWPNWEPALSLIIPYPLQPSPQYNCSETLSIICTALRVAAIIPPTFSGSGGDLKAGLPIFSPIPVKIFKPEKIGQCIVRLQPFPMDFSD